MGSGKAQNQYDGTEAGYDHKDMQDMWQDVFPPGGGAALAGLLPGMPGEAPAGGDDHQNVPQMWTQLHVLHLLHIPRSPLCEWLCSVVWRRFTSFLNIFLTIGQLFPVFFFLESNAI